MKLIELVTDCINDSETYITDVCCPSDYGTDYEKYENQCAGKTCKECWNQEVEI